MLDVVMEMAMEAKREHKANVMWGLETWLRWLHGSLQEGEKGGEIP